MNSDDFRKMMTLLESIETPTHQIDEGKEHHDVSSGKWAASVPEGQKALNTASNIVYNKPFEQLDPAIRKVLVAAITAAATVEEWWKTDWLGNIKEHYSQFMCPKPEDVINRLRSEYPEIITDNKLNSAVKQTVKEWRKYHRTAAQ
jgi:hypothetical protein